MAMTLRFHYQNQTRMILDKSQTQKKVKENLQKLSDLISNIKFGFMIEIRSGINHISHHPLSVKTLRPRFQKINKQQPNNDNILNQLMSNYNSLAIRKTSCFTQLIHCLCCCLKNQSKLSTQQLTLDTIYKFYGLPGKMWVAKVTLQNCLLEKPPKNKNQVHSNEIYQTFFQREDLPEDELNQLLHFIVPQSMKFSISKHDLQKVLPLSVSQHIAGRIAKFTKDIVVDVFCGSGNLCIELKFAQIKNVQGYAFSEEQLGNVTENVKQFKNNITIFSDSFLERTQRADVIILHTQFISNEALLQENKQISSYLYFDKITKYFDKAIQLSENIILILPATFNNDQICAFLSEWAYKNQHSFRQVEIQKINLCGHSLCQVVYIGFICDEEIVSNELKKCCLNQLLLDQKQIKNESIIKHMRHLEQIIKSIGHYQTILLIEKAITLQTPLDHQLTIFTQLVAQLKIVETKDIEQELDVPIVDQTPTLNHPLLQKNNSHLYCSSGSGIQKQRSSIRTSQDNYSSKNSSQLKPRIFSFGNKTIE